MQPTYELTATEQTEAENFAIKFGRRAIVRYLKSLQGNKSTDEKLILKNIEYFIGRGADVHAETSEGTTHKIKSIHWAARMGSVKVSQFLLSQGADVNSLTNRGESPLHWATSKGDIELIRFLLSNGAVVDEIAHNDGTPLQIAAYEGNIEVAEFLISKGACINYDDSLGIHADTPLHKAIQGGRIELVKFLVSKGANVNEASYRSGTPLQIAVKNGNVEIIEFLVSKGANANPQNVSPLHTIMEKMVFPVMEIIFAAMKKIVHYFYGIKTNMNPSSNKPITNIWQTEPLLRDELIHRQESLLPELERKKIDSWETLEKQDPDTATRLWDQLQRSRILYNLEMLQHLELPYGSMSPKEYATNFYNEELYQVYNCQTRAIEGDIESIFRLSEYYLSPGDEVPADPYFAFRLMRLAAESGYQPAYPVLGKHYAYGIGTSKNIEEAVRWFLQTDYSQDVDILELMALAYHSGTGVPKDETKAYDYGIEAAIAGHPNSFHFLQIAADAGYARGQYFLGLSYQHGISTSVDIHKAVQLFHLAAEQNYVDAQCRLGILYSDGELDIERDPEVAVQWFKLAAAQNDIAARNRLAICLAVGDGIKQDKGEAARIWKDLTQETPENLRGVSNFQYHLGMLLMDKEYAGYNPREGIKWLRKSAEQNDAMAQAALGMMYYGGLEDVIKQNWKEARTWLRRAAKQGDNEAQYYLGEIYFNGYDVPEDRKEAFKWYKQSAEGGDIQAQQKTAHCYLHGIGTRKNDDAGYLTLGSLASWGDEEALTLLQSAATAGNSSAEYSLCICYREKNDWENAHLWLEKAAEKGHAQALCAMGFRYWREGDDEQKLRYFRLAAEKGDAEAQVQLALWLEIFNNKKAPQNEEAVKWMQAALDQGYAKANYHMGNFYRTGIWVDADDQKAFEYYSKAAELGISDGIDRLGECYRFGIGVPADDHAAFLYFQRAAQMGNPKGLCNLGLCYLNGIGCRQDTGLAFSWITAAIDTGDPVIYQILQYEGVDLEKLSRGYEQFRQHQTVTKGDKFGESFDRIFDSPNNSIQPIPPNEHGKE